MLHALDTYYYTGTTAGLCHYHFLTVQCRLRYAAIGVISWFSVQYNSYPLPVIASIIVGYIGVSDIRRFFSHSEPSRTTVRKYCFGQCTLGSGTKF